MHDAFVIRVGLEEDLVNGMRLLGFLRGMFVLFA